MGTLTATVAAKAQAEVPGHRALVAEVASLVGLRLIAALAVLGSGFRAISDDDYARTVIAQRFVAAPKLDPSGTSWLPFPFHAMGGAMALFGRSIEVARGASVALALAGGVAMHLALVVWGVPRRARVLGMAAVAVLPWTLWTTVATVPEAFTAAFVASAVLFAALPADRATTATRLVAAGLACAATLSRYEAWPAALVVAGALAASLRELVLEKTASVARGARATRGAAFAAVFLALAGIVVWMIWNRVTHGSATHFLFRVARYKKSLAAGQPEGTLLERLLAYPRLLAIHFPEAIVALVVFAAHLRDRGPLARARAVSLAAAGAILAFLVVGNINDGAPTHHAERALLAAVFCLIPLAVASVAAAGPRGAWFVAAGVLGLVELGHLCARERPGAGAADRAVQVARGHALRGEPNFRVVPCAYEHFALIAAYGAPERVEVGTEPKPTAGHCPHVKTEARK